MKAIVPPMPFVGGTIEFKGFILDGATKYGDGDVENFIAKAIRPLTVKEVTGNEQHWTVLLVDAEGTCNRKFHCSCFF